MTSALVRRAETIPVKVLADRVVQRLREAEKGLRRATRIDQVKLVADVAAAQYIFATRQRLGEDVIGYAREIKTFALARLGELLKPLEKQAGARGRSGAGTRGSKKEPQVGAPPTLSDLGIDKKTSHVAQQLATLPAKELKTIATGKTTLSKVRREGKKVALRKRADLPDAKFRVLYADPPWSYNDKADAGSVQVGGAAHQYPTMTIAELCTLKVRAICEDNAVLCLWVTSPLLFEAAPVIKAWGFEYKTSFVWDKVKHNMGHYNSPRHEFLLVCVRGSCTPDVQTLFDSVQVIKKKGHSEKPEQFRKIIDTLYPHGKRVELFARKTPPKPWAAWGNELPESDAS